MSVAGGSSDKFGNAYEGLWAIDQLMRVVDCASLAFVLEPLDPDESRGIEFRVTLPRPSSEYWSIKRQTTKAAGWTLALLAAKDDHGRAILADLFAHAERDPSNLAVFASTLGAPQLQELHEYANDRAKFEERLKKSGQLSSAFEQYVVPLAMNDAEGEQSTHDQKQMTINTVLFANETGSAQHSCV